MLTGERTGDGRELEKLPTYSVYGAAKRGVSILA